MDHAVRSTVAAVLMAAVAAAVSRPALAQEVQPQPQQQAPAQQIVATKTIEGECKIGEGGPGLYRSTGAHHSCGLYAAPEGSIFYVVDETGEGVDLTAANRGAKLNAPDGKTSTCGRGSMVILAVIAITTESDGFQRSVYNAACIPGPFKPEPASRRKAR